MQYLIAYIFLRCISILPISFIRAIGGAIGIIIFYAIKKPRVRITNNLLKTGIINQDDPLINQYIKDVAKEQGKTILETAAISWMRSTKYCANLVIKSNNAHVVDDANKNGKGIIFLTPHMSAFEINIKHIQRLIKRQIVVLYKPNKKAWINKLMHKGRTDNIILPVAISKTGISRIVKELHNGGIIGILPDSAASSGSGIEATFFNNKLFATTLAAKMILQNDVNVIMTYVIRIPGGFSVDYIKIAKDEDENLESMVQKIYKTIEKIVMLSPKQYYWSYDRFRHIKRF